MENNNSLYLLKKNSWPAGVRHRGHSLYLPPPSCLSDSSRGALLKMVPVKDMHDLRARQERGGGEAAWPLGCCCFFLPLLYCSPKKGISLSRRAATGPKPPLVQIIWEVPSFHSSPDRDPCPFLGHMLGHEARERERGGGEGLGSCCCCWSLSMEKGGCWPCPALLSGPLSLSLSGRGQPFLLPEEEGVGDRPLCRQQPHGLHHRRPLPDPGETRGERYLESTFF